MTTIELLGLAGALILQAGGVTAYAYNKFSTKDDLDGAVNHLREIGATKQEAVLAKLDHLHECVHELKETIKQQMEWKK